jgi:hypothetical protein
MTKKEEYRARLRSLKDWDAFLMQNSGLPGPRGNLELAQAAADEGSPSIFFRYLANDPATAPTNSPREFLAFCGVLGLGRLVAEGRHDLLGTLRRFASDPRWRVREAVAMALQCFGDFDMGSLVKEMRQWAKGSPLEQRAAAAGLCEPRLLATPRHARAVLQILDTITSSVESSNDRRSESFLVLRKGLAYCWSVAAAGMPDEGLPKMERWLRSSDPDVRWIMKQNLSKARLARANPAWVRTWTRRISKP